MGISSVLHVTAIKPFTINFHHNVLKQWFIPLLIFSSLSLVTNLAVSNVYGVDEPPYTLNVKIETMVDGLRACGVSFVFVPDGRIFCGELARGEVRVIENWQVLPEPLIKLDVYQTVKPSGLGDERGLIGIAIDPEFEKNHYVYLHWTYLDADTQQPYKRIARFTESNNKLTNMYIILDKIPAGYEHVGGPLEFGPDGKLYITGGDSTQRLQAQNASSPLGKVLRLNPDGSIPDDNPFPGLPTYTMGHRNVFGIGFHPITNIPYVTENGISENDEVNMLIPGKNYGWPDVTGKNNDERFVDPLLTFTPTVAPTELIFYTGTKYPEEVNNMFFVTWGERTLYRVILKPPSYDEVLSFDKFNIPLDRSSLTDIEQGPDGYLYASSFRSIVRLVFDYSNIATTISLDVKSDTEAHESIKLTARILDYFGNPIPNVSIDFFDSDELIGSAVSNEEGIAQLEYTSDSANEHTFNAKFSGDPKYKASYSPNVIPEFPIHVSMFVMAGILAISTVLFNYRRFIKYI
ncbi:MAG: glucose/arabinose dehydrogenase [Candidatus Nitrosomirales archaeon]|jgi:glucose/arabinose dehydrogenase